MAETTNRHYPKPVSSHLISDDIAVLEAQADAIDADVQGAYDELAGKAPTAHTHVIADVTGLQSALDAKMPASQTFALDDLTDVDGAAGAATGYVLYKTAGGLWVPGSPAAVLGPHSHSISDVTGLQSALDAKLDDSQLDTDGTLAANNDARIPSQKAVKTYVGANGVTGANLSAGAATAPADTGFLPWITAAGALAKVTWANAWAYFKGKADALYATAAQGAKADAAMPKTGGTFTGAITATLAASAVPVAIKSDSASYRAWLLFYQGAANQAQIGVLEDTNLHIGVNDDSAVYREAMNVQRTTGNVTFPQAMFVTGPAQVGQGLNALGGVYDVSQRVYSPNNKQFSTNGNVGDYVLAVSSTSYAYSANAAGSNLTPASTSGATSSGALSGTWRCLGTATAGGQVTLFQRIA